MADQGGAGVLIGTDENAPKPIPNYAIAILVVGVFIITAIILVIILIKYRNYSYAKVASQVKTDAIVTQIADQRRALFSQP